MYGDDDAEYRDDAAEPPALVCQVGSTTLRYHVSAVDDLHAWLREQGDGVALGAADEQGDQLTARLPCMFAWKSQW